MPPVAADTLRPALSNSTNSSFDGLPRKSYDKTITASGVFTYTNGTDVDTGLPDHRLDHIKSLRNPSHTSLTNGVPSTSLKSHEQFGSKTGSTHSISREDRLSGPPEGLTKLSNVENVSESQSNYTGRDRAQSQPTDLKVNIPTVRTEQHQDSHMNTAATQPDQAWASNSDSLSPTNTRHLQPQRISAPPGLSPVPTRQSHSTEQPQLTHRHTALGVPKAGTGRASRDFSFTGGPSEEAVYASGRFSPTRDSHEPRHRRASLNLIRRTTRSHSDAHLDEVPPDEDAARWTEIVKQKRASRRARRREEEDDDRVVVGKKVEEGHVNWVTAYNMLTGIRFTVSRINAKMDRELTDADFDAKHKFSFDVTGNELTPSAKYDFKFKDYAPWVFRHLRAIFGLDPADYLMSLTSKYILSELGSPGKSGSFFYFSRDYKYIIKTIHHAEHKLLRRILRDYHNHVLENPNTLISQIYGLHRVKIPYGRKIHFLVMNNLFPPHRDIHQTFDLKGSTVGRDFREEELADNPRATLKDLNWLRRDYHLEFDPQLKQLFIEQLQRDVALLQKLHIMDYSLLVGIHDLNKGNEEGLREANLRVFQPGGGTGEEPHSMLMRTPSRLENIKKARELRGRLKRERPVPIGLVNTQMPDEMEVGDIRKDRLFYKNDGGIRATHEDGDLGELVYYLGVIDCLTHYGFVKRLEHFWKGLKDNRSQISPIPPQQYGDRFLNFVTGITMTKEEAERRRRQTGESALSEVAPIGFAASQRTSLAADPHSSLDVDRTNEKLAAKSPPGSPMAVEHTMAKAQKQVDRETGEKGRRRSEEEKPVRTLLTTEDAKSHTLLPVVSEENMEGSRVGSASASRSPSQSQSQNWPLPKQEQQGQGGDVERELRRKGSEGIKIVQENPGETDFCGYEKVSVQMPGPGHGTDSDPGWDHVDGAAAEKQDSQQRSKAPRINSDIIPPFSPFDAPSGLGTGDPEKTQRDSLR
ncbi:uncharacterized protein HMPREF1541_10478 [Cyphellophora europaea CBS 101466]|uniref:1-phosphatidylinositol-4-phosphate 5-kinase n=1 Tax=Cyphellophora europaea (strain CBS 101466) TaxID=1220924 RepID=W2S8B4_CYPE1|nr:uncharacterized protein HMPREF1541_10478 [Cyphellophora europaea CBS 101466]ETN44298.1 hypothetical protein HMPREF1541_10478 [Cyphellophora europaea CBS 101466]